MHLSLVACSSSVCRFLQPAFWSSRILCSASYSSYCLTVGRSDRLILELQIASSAIRGVDPCLDLGNPQGWMWNGIRGRDEKWNQLGTRSTHGDHGTERKPSPVSGAPGRRSTVLVPVPCRAVHAFVQSGRYSAQLAAAFRGRHGASRCSGRSQRDESCPASAAPIASWCDERKPK